LVQRKKSTSGPEEKERSPPRRMGMRRKGGKVKRRKVKETKDGQEGQKERHRTVVGRLKI
jgi:hypothetical protein